MKRISSAVLAFLISAMAFGQKDNRITIGTVDTVSSAILKEQRKILVYVPSRGGAPVDTAQRFPVLYLLDGDAHFASVVGMIQQLSQVNSNTVCPEMIVVGISNTNRTRDLTPTRLGDDPYLKYLSPAIKTASGGGEAFLSFLEKELIPHIDQKYPTQPYKLLMGHSFGGLTALHALTTRTPLFRTYISIDPSMWWDNTAYLKEAKKRLAEKEFSGTTLYLAMARTIDQPMDLKKLRKDTTLETQPMRATLDLDQFLQSGKGKGLRYASKYYEDHTHNSVPLIAAYDALRFIFADYPLTITNSDVLDSTVAFAEKHRQRYQRISALYGYEVKPPEWETNVWGYRFLQRKQYRKAEGFFKLNVQLYPNSANVYDSYGDFFVATGDKAKAIDQFKKALSLKEDANTRNKLNKLLE
ncbi:MAG TPA: alpha/beta hydrolase-fold protein [Chitinophagaceae bacterium]|nr:alpha/beta hydrolase-fold protein [Chitinophagaceae bacterium]